MEVIEAEHGQRAIEILQESVRLDLILLDMRMPVMGGMTFLNEFEAMVDKKHIPITILSNDGSDIMSMRAALKGYTEYLIKAEHTLVQIVEKVRFRLVSQV